MSCAPEKGRWPQWAGDCPCDDGPLHLVSPQTADLIEARGPLVILEVPGFGAWLVPRVYIAAHGFKGSEVSALAEKYGWEKA